MNPLEINILEQFKKGDENAFEYIYKTYYSWLINYAKQILKDYNVAEDVVENTFLTLWENRGHLEIESSIKSYLFKSVYNQCLNHIKHSKVEDRYYIYFKHHVDTDNSGNMDYNNYPLSKIIDNEIDQKLNKALDNLPPQCREVFLLSRYENLNNEEIALQLKVSVNTVRTHISRALNKLRTELKEFLPSFIAILF